MKTCSNCKQKKAIINFAKNRQQEDGLHTYCKSCMSDYYAKWYQTNSSSHKKSTKERKHKQTTLAQKYVIEYLRTHPCVDCGNSDIRTLEFDHVKGKKLYSISTMLHRGSSVKRIQEEIQKCEVRCANCHRIKTIQERKWFKNFLN